MPRPSRREVAELLKSGVLPPWAQSCLSMSGQEACIEMMKNKEWQRGLHALPEDIRMKVMWHMAPDKPSAEMLEATEEIKEINMTVLVGDLQKRPDLNGRVGKRVGPFNEDTKRGGVEMLETGEKVNVHQKNMEPVAPGDVDDSNSFRIHPIDLMLWRKHWNLAPNPNDLPHQPKTYCQNNDDLADAKSEAAKNEVDPVDAEVAANALKLIEELDMPMIGDNVRGFRNATEAMKMHDEHEGEYGIACTACHIVHYLLGKQDFITPGAFEDYIRPMKGNKLAIVTWQMHLMDEMNAKSNRLVVQRMFNEHRVAKGQSPIDFKDDPIVIGAGHVGDGEPEVGDWTTFVDKNASMKPSDMMKQALSRMPLNHPDRPEILRMLDNMAQPPSRPPPPPPPPRSRTVLPARSARPSLPPIADEALELTNEEDRALRSMDMSELAKMMTEGEEAMNNRIDTHIRNQRVRDRTNHFANISQSILDDAGVDRPTCSRCGKAGTVGKKCCGAYMGLN